MTYKALNTFIDDIFAFVIKMPTMYRLGCFRDDIVFFIFLYQRYIYKEDKSRVNEFGFSGDMLEDMEKKPAVDSEDVPAITQDNPEAEADVDADEAAITNTDATSGAWKNSQKPKSKKSKKND